MASLAMVRTTLAEYHGSNPRTIHNAPTDNTGYVYHILQSVLNPVFFLSTLGAVPTVHGTNQIRMDPPYFHMATDYPLSLSTRGCILRSNTSRFDGILRIIALVKAFIESFLNDIVL